MSLPRFSLRNPIFAHLLLAALFVSGLLALRRIPTEVYPEISLNFAVIETTWLGASPDEVERLVTTPIEDEIKRIAGIKELTSFSLPGVSTITIEWDEALDGNEHEHALNEVRAALDRLDELPLGSDAPHLKELTSSEFLPVCLLALVDHVGVGERRLREVARRVREDVERLPGVHRAAPTGVRDPELHVAVDRERALQYDITLPEIATVIEHENRNHPAGFLERAGGELRLRGVGDVPTPDSLREMVVRKDPNGFHVRLGEVADVGFGFERARTRARHRGKPAVLLAIAKDTDADIIEVTTTLRGYVANNSSRLPDGLELEITWDSASSVAERLQILRSNLLLGIGFVCVLLWLSFGLRNALLTIAGVPLAYLFALSLFPLIGASLNALSVIGLILVSGMLVDDSILVVDNIQRRRDSGESLDEAVLRGAEQVMWPVVAAVATTIVAFVPMLLVPGMTGKFMRILPITVVLCLLASLLEVLVMLPNHYRHLHGLRAGARSTRRGASRRAAIARLQKQAQSLFRRFQSRVLGVPYALLLACLAMLVFTSGLLRHALVELFPNESNRLHVTLQLSSEVGLNRTDAVMRDLEALVDEMGEEVEGHTTVVGTGMSADSIPVEGSNYGLLYVTLSSDPSQPTRVANAVERLRSKLETFRSQGGDLIENLTAMPPRDGPPVGRPVAIRVRADGYEEARVVSRRLEETLRAIPGVYNVEDNLPPGPRELRLVPDEFRAGNRGLTFSTVGTALRAANDGLVASSFRDPGAEEDVDIRVLLREDQRQTVNDLLQTPIRAASGQLVRLVDISRSEIQDTYQWLPHFGGRRSIVVYADVDNEQATSLQVNEAIRSWFASLGDIPEGVELIYGGEFELTGRTFDSVLQTLVLAALGIYTILAVQFRSYLQPLLIMTAIPLAFAGAIAGICLMGLSLSVYVMYALVGLAGIVVNDALVLVDFANRERRRGRSARDAVLAASEQRLRPVLLTTLTTATGLLPMALGMGGQSATFGPFAATLVCGVLVATGLTLFVVPAGYLILDRGQHQEPTAADHPEKLDREEVLAN